MGFLDKNTRIIDMVLTDLGRELYSKGELDFTYYAFSDDGIDYDPYLSNSGSLTDSQLVEERDRQIEATTVNEALFGLNKGVNSNAEDKTNIKNLLFTVPQGQTIVPEMLISPNVVSGSIESKQQKVVERFVKRNQNGDVITINSELDRGYRKFKAQKFLIDINMGDFFNEASLEGYSIRILMSGSDGLREIKHKRDKNHIISFSNDLQIYKDDEIEKVAKQIEDAEKVVIE